MGFCRNLFSGRALLWNHVFNSGKVQKSNSGKVQICTKIQILWKPVFWQSIVVEPCLQFWKSPNLHKNSNSVETYFLAEHCCGTMFTILEKSKFAQKFKFCGNLFSGRALLWNHVYNSGKVQICTKIQILWKPIFWQSI